MKTKFWNLLLVPVFMICCVMSFSSCSDDDDDDSTTTTIVGTWESELEGYTVQFKSNLTGVESLTSGGTFIQSAFEYKYDDSKNTVTIIGSDETILLENGTYEIFVGPQKMTFGGLNFSRK